MNRELKLHFLKQIINFPVRILDKLIKMPEPTYPQTRMLLRTYKVMQQTYRLDCSRDTFGDKPDGNFERLMRLSVKLLSQISERDRYYRSWIGLLYLLARDETLSFRLPPAEFKWEIKRQWQDDLTELPNHWFTEEPADFVEWLLCHDLYNLATNFFMGTELPKQKI